MATDALSHGPERRNRNVAAILFLVAVGMVGAAYAAVPLYQLFCQVTGYGGTTRVASDNPEPFGPRNRAHSSRGAALSVTASVKTRPTMNLICGV